jgi:hypothetical protein
VVEVEVEVEVVKEVEGVQAERETARRFPALMRAPSVNGGSSWFWGWWDALASMRREEGRSI